MLGFGRKAKTAAKTVDVHHSVVTWERGHVRAAVVELGESAAVLLGVAAAPVHGIGRTTHPDPDRWLAGCNQALTQAEDMTAVAAGRKIVPDAVMMSVPPEVTRTLPIVVSLRRQEAEHGVTYDELRFLVQRGYRKAQDVLGTATPQAGTKPLAEEIIHGVVAECLLDGQAVLDPSGLHGKQLELSMSFALAPLEWVRTLETLAERLPINLTAIVPQHVAYTSPLSDAASVLILLDEHHTAVSLARHGRPSWTALVEMGEREMTSATAAGLGLRGRQADALMRAYRARQLRDDVELQLAQTFWIELRRWMVAIAEGVSACKERAPLPFHVYFSDLTRRMPEAEQALQTTFWQECLPFDRCPEITTLTMNTVRDVVDRTAQASGPGYLPLRAMAHYVAQVYAPTNSLDRMLLDSIRWRRPGIASKAR
jgi:hypothetical protein